MTKTYLYYNVFSKEIIEGYEIGTGTKNYMRVMTGKGEVKLPKDRWMQIRNAPNTKAILNQMVGIAKNTERELLQFRNQLKTFIDEVLKQLSEIPDTAPQADPDPDDDDEGNQDPPEPSATDQIEN